MTLKKLQQLLMGKSIFFFFKSRIKKKLTLDFGISMKYNGSADTQVKQQLAISQQTLQVLQRPISISDNNNHQTLDVSQIRRLSRTHENMNPDKNALAVDPNHAKSSNETHYIKNKALQSPVNRYKVIYVNCH